MLKKVHLRLTGFFFGVTALILFFLSGLCLFISEQNLKKNSFSSFCSQVSIILSDLETQTLFTSEWLSQAEKSGNFLIHIQDSGIDFLWGTESPGRAALVTKILDYYEHTYLLQPGPHSSWHTEFTYRNGSTDYFVSVATSVREKNTLTILILKPLHHLQAQLNRQRILFIFPSLAAAILLLLFSYYYTGRLLQPIQRNQEAQTAFVASASHELRTPLSVILSAAAACQKADAAQKEHFLSIICQEGETMSRLITQLLTLSGEDISPASHICECEPDTLLLEIYEAYDLLAKESSHILQIRLPETKITPIQCDIGRIRQVFSILLNNAFSYTPSKSRILLTLEAAPGELHFVVADNGPGIPDPEKEKIFQRFYRMDSSHQTNGHFGLGLATAARLMENCGGHIRVTDTPGGGATFILTFPYASREEVQ